MSVINYNNQQALGLSPQNFQPRSGHMPTGKWAEFIISVAIIF